MDADGVLVLFRYGFAHVTAPGVAAAAAAGAGAAVPGEHAGRGGGCTLDATTAVQVRWSNRACVGRGGGDHDGQQLPAPRLSFRLPPREGYFPARCRREAEGPGFRSWARDPIS